MPAMSTSEPLPGLVDSHCHLTWESFDGDHEDALARMAESGVDQAVVVATSIEDAHRTAALCEGRAPLFPTAGIHPNDVGSHEESDDLDEQLAALADLLASGTYVGVGETGLDYYRDYSDPSAQQRSFHAHCALAVKHDLPVIVHIRDKADSWTCFDDVGDVIEAHDGLRGVIHCYTGDVAHAERYLATGFYVSFAGILTFPKGENVREAARAVPLARTLVETDAPFLAPVPYRGKRNEPAFVAHTAARLAEIKGVSETEARAVTAQNARDLFGLPTPAGPVGSPDA